MSTSNAYDEVPYPSYVHSQTHPDQLATLATLHGMQPRPVSRSRILELACGQGGNLIPLAVSYSNCECVGIDLAEKQIALGQQVIDRVGLTNIKLLTQSILDFSPAMGKFDYIIAHGVFSWVPESVRDKILQICCDQLSPHGVAIISYNTFPGWHQRRMIRDMMQYHTKTLPTPEKKIEQAKAFLQFMTQAVADDNAYGKSLHEEFRSLSEVDEAYLFHEQLEEINEPRYFHEFADQAARHELQYLCEVELSNLQLQRYPPQVAEMLGKMETIQRDQYLDFLMRRTFRQTLVCHREISLQRNDLPDRIEHLRVSSSLLAGCSPEELRMDKPLVLKGPDGQTLTIGDAMLKAAFGLMGKLWPASIPVSELQSAVRRDLSGGRVVVQTQADYHRDSQTLAHSLVHAFIAGVARFHSTNDSFVTQVTEKPLACPLARHQASLRTYVTNRQHRSISLDQISCRLLTLLDGQTDFDSMLEQLVCYVVETGLAVQRDGRVLSMPAEIRSLLSESLRLNLETLGRQALLIG